MRFSVDSAFFVAVALATIASCCAGCSQPHGREQPSQESAPADKGPCTGDLGRQLVGKDIGTQLFRPRSLETLAVSADGSVLVSAGGSEAVIWDPASGRPRRKFDAWSGQVSLSADGAWLGLLDFSLMGSSLQVRSVESGEVRKRWKVEGSDIGRLALDRTGEFLAVSPHSGAVEVRHVAGQQKNRTLPGHQGEVRALAYSPTESHRLVTGGEKGQLKLWDTRTGQALDLQAGEKSVMAVGFSSDGTQLVAGDSDGVVRVYQISSQLVSDQAADQPVTDGAPSKEFLARVPDEPGEIRGVALSRGGHRLVVGTWSGAIALWDVDRASLISVLGEGGLVASAVAFTPDGKTAMGGVNWGAIRFWDAETGAERRHPEDGNLTDTDALVWSMDGHRAVVAAGGKWANVWDMRCGKLVARLDGHTRRVEQVAATPDGRLIATGDNAGRVRLWDGKSLQLVRAARHHAGDVHALALSGDGKLLASGGRGGHVVVRDTASGRVVFERAEDIDSDTIFALALSHDGRVLVTGDTMGHVQWLDTATGAPLAIRSDDYPSNVRSIEFSPDGRYLSTTASDKVRVFATASAELMVTFKAPGWSITNAVWFADSRRLAFGDSDGHLWVADVAAGEVLQAQTVENLNIRAVALHGDGATLLTGHRNTTLRLWDSTQIPSLASDAELELEVEKTPASTLAAAHPLPRSAALQCPGAPGVGQDSAKNPGPLPACAVFRMGAGHFRLESALEEEVGVLRFSSDGKLLAAGGSERLAIHELPSGRVRQTLACCMAAPKAALFSPDGAWLAVTPYAGATQMWNLQAGRKEARWNDSAQVLAVSPDGKHWAGADRNGRIWLTDRSGRATRTLPVRATAPAQRLAFSPDGARLLSLQGWQLVDIRDVASGQVLWSLMGAEEELPEGLGEDYVLWAGFGQKGDILLYTATQRFRRSASGDWSSTPMGLTTDGVVLPTLSEFCAPDGRACALRTDTELRVSVPGGPQRVLPMGASMGPSTESIDRFSFGPQGKQLIVAADEALALWDVEGQRRLSRAPVPVARGPLSMSSTGIFMTLQEKDLRLWRLSASEPEQVVNQAVTTALLSTDGRFAVAIQKAGLIRITIASGKARVLAKGQFPGILALSGDDKRVATLRTMSRGDREEAVLEVRDASTGKVLSTRSMSADDLYGAWVALSHRGDLVATSASGKVEVWALADSRATRLAARFDVEHAVEHLAFSPDGKTLITAGDSHLEMYSTGNGEHLGMLGDHGNVQSFGLSADGRYLVSGGLDQLVRVFDVERKRVLAVLTGHERWVNSVAVSSDSLRAVSVDAGGTILEWDLAPVVRAR